MKEEKEAGRRVRREEWNERRGTRQGGVAAVEGRNVIIIKMTIAPLVK